MSRCDSSMHGKSRRCGSCNDSAQLVFAASKISAEDCALNMLCAEENTSERLSGNMAHSISRQARHVDAGNERRRTWTRKDKSSRVHVPPQKSDFSAASSGCSFTLRMLPSFVFVLTSWLKAPLSPKQPAGDHCGVDTAMA